MALNIWKKKMASLESLTDWQLKCDGLLQRGEFLFQSSLWADCAFLVGPTQTPVRAHRFILAMGSPVFETMFYGSIPEGMDPIPIPDIEPIVFLQMLRYIYSDKVYITNIPIAFELHYCAKKYMLPYLVQICTKYLSENLTPHNVCSVYEYAAFHDEHQLLHDCLKVMKSRTQEILNSPGFIEAQLETIIMMFSLEPLNIESEIQLFEAIDRYAVAQQVKREETLATEKEKEKEKESSEKDKTEKDVPELAITTIDDDLEMIELPPLVIELNSSDDESHLIPKRRRRKKRKAVENENESTSKNNADAEKDSDPPQDAKRSLRAALRLIRFLTLSPPELAKCRSASNLLSREELFAILMNISSEDTYEPMPEGFSTCRTPRNAPYILGIVMNHEYETQRFSSMQPINYDTRPPTVTSSMFMSSNSSQATTQNDSSITQENPRSQVHINQAIQASSNSRLWTPLRIGEPIHIRRIVIPPQDADTRSRRFEPICDLSTRNRLR